MATITKKQRTAGPGEAPEAVLEDLPNDCLFEVSRQMGAPSLRHLLRCISRQFAAAILKPLPPPTTEAPTCSGVESYGHFRHARSFLMEAAAETDNVALAEWALRRTRERITKKALFHAATRECFRKLVALVHPRPSAVVDRLRLAAAYHGDADTLQQLGPIHTFRSGAPGLAASACARANNMVFLEWLDSFCTLPIYCYVVAAGRNDMDLLQWLALKSSIAAYPPRAWAHAADRTFDQLLQTDASLACVQFLWDEGGFCIAHGSHDDRYMGGTRVHYNAVCIAARNRRMDVAEWLAKERNIVTTPTHLFLNAVCSGDMDSLQRALDMFSPSLPDLAEARELLRGESLVTCRTYFPKGEPVTFSAAVPRHIIEHYGVTPDITDFSRAIARGERELAALVLSHLNPRPSSCHITIHHPSKLDHLYDGTRTVEMLEWLLQNDISVTRILLCGGMAWDIWPVVAWAIEHGVPVEPWSAYQEQQNGWFVAVMDYYRAHGSVPRICAEEGENELQKLVWCCD